MKAMQINATQSPNRERYVKLGQHDIEAIYRDDVLYINPKEKLKAYPQKLTDRLIHFAQHKPEHTFAAKRNLQGEWVKLSYAETLQRAWHIAQALHNRNLSQDRPLLILSGNDLEHLVLSMAAMLAGVPFSAISPAYSLISKDFGKLKHVFEVLTPGMVYASDGQAFASAIETCTQSDIEIVTNTGIIGTHTCTAFQTLLDTPVTNVHEFY
ncbi:MAG: AMP-binding protein, partial [Acinetobacter sp.]